MQVPPPYTSYLFTTQSRSRSEASLKKVRKELLHSSRVREVNQLVDIARRFASDMKLLKPSLTREINQYVPLEKLFISIVIVFVFSTVLRLFFMFLDHKYHLAERLFPNVAAANKKIVAKPTLHVPENMLVLYLLMNKNWDFVFVFLRLFLPHRNQELLWIL